MKYTTLFLDLDNTLLDFNMAERVAVRKVLESYGYVMQAPRGGSSHYTFRKPGYTKITIPKHNPIKRVYVEMVKDIVENEVLDNEIH